MVYDPVLKALRLVQPPLPGKSRPDGVIDGPQDNE